MSSCWVTLIRFAELREHFRPEGRYLEGLLEASLTDHPYGRMLITPLHPYTASCHYAYL